ncbi:hypothetical protein BLOT_016109, partial [Blomia tropicalis]
MAKNVNVMKNLLNFYRKTIQMAMASYTKFKFELNQLYYNRIFIRFNDDVRGFRLDMRMSSEI